MPPLRKKSLCRRLLPVLPLLLLAGCVPDRLLFSTPHPATFTPAPISDVPLHDVIFPSGELRLHGWHLPGDAEQPLILYFHGTGTSLAAEAEGVIELRQRLGLPVFAFDYRGFGSSQGRPSVQGLFDDARAALAFLQANGWKRERMVFYGHSLGAAVALQLALETPPAAVVLESPFTSLLDLISWHYPLAGSWLAWIFPDYYNNLGKIEHLHTPLLLIHGDKDTKVPSFMAHRLFSRAPGPKSLLLVAGGDHEAPRRAAGTIYWNGWRGLLERCFPDSLLAAAPTKPLE